MTNSIIDYQLIRICLIGFGYRGKYIEQLLSKMPQCRVVGIADPQVTSIPSREISLYNNGEADYQHMIDREQPNLVVIASPWEVQITQALYCVERGIGIGLEIRGGTELDSYEELLRRSRAKGVRVYPLENTVFMREIMAIWNMIEQDVFGELIYMRGGYRHDLRHLLVNEHGELGGSGTAAAWRALYYTHKDADLYPTHGFAPLALLAGLRNAEDIVHLDAQCSSAKGLKSYIEHLGGQAPQSLMADIVTTQLATRQGTLIHLIHDTTLPRPKSLDYEIQGVKGIWNGERRAIYLEGISPEGEWEDDAPYIDNYEHHLWQRWGFEALLHDKHHVGMDYIMLRTMLQDRIEPGIYPTYLSDLALWSSITPLSSRAILQANEHNQVDKTT